MGRVKDGCDLALEGRYGAWTRRETVVSVWVCGREYSVGSRLGAQYQRRVEVLPVWATGGGAAAPQSTGAAGAATCAGRCSGLTISSGCHWEASVATLAIYLVQAVFWRGERERAVPPPAPLAGSGHRQARAGLASQRCWNGQATGARLGQAVALSEGIQWLSYEQQRSEEPVRVGAENYCRGWPGAQASRRPASQPTSLLVQEEQVSPTGLVRGTKPDVATTFFLFPGSHLLFFFFFLFFYSISLF